MTFWQKWPFWNRDSNAIRTEQVNPPTVEELHPNYNEDNNADRVEVVNGKRYRRELLSEFTAEVAPFNIDFQMKGRAGLMLCGSTSSGGTYSPNAKLYMDLDMDNNDPDNSDFIDVTEVCFADELYFDAATGTIKAPASCLVDDFIVKDVKGEVNGANIMRLVIAETNSDEVSGKIYALFEEGEL